MRKSADRSKKGKRAVAKDAVRKPDWVREIEEACDKGVKSALRKLRAEERKQLKFAANHSVKFENVAEVAEALRIYADLVNRGSLIPPLPEWLFMENFADRAIPHKDITIE